MKKIKISLMLQIMILCVSLVMVASLTFRLYAYQTAKNAMEDTIGHMALTITRSVAHTIDGDKHQELDKPEDMESDYYINMRSELNRIKNETGLKYLYTMSMSQDGTYYFVLDGIEVGSEEESLLGDVEEEMSDIMIASLSGAEGYEFAESEEWGTLVSGYAPIKNSQGETVALLGADFDVSYMMDKLTSAKDKMLGMTVGILIISIIATISFAYLMVRSLKKLNTKVRAIQNGDFTVEIESERNDEVGNLTRSFQKMLANMSSMIHNIRNHSEEALRDIDSLNSNVDISNKATEEITKIVGEIAIGAIQQVENVEEVESSMGRVFLEIEKITDNIETVNQDSDRSMQDMQEASEKINNSVMQINLVNDTIETTASVMKNLQDKFQEVLSFSDMVEAIASRTNLLALNASIEAASAGVHGKGFGVVAGEIKNLAKQSGDASKKINELIQMVQDEIGISSEAIGTGVLQAKAGVEVMTQVELQLNKMSSSNEKINKRIKEIAMAIARIEEDSKNVLEKTNVLADIARELSFGTQQTSAETEEQYAIMEGIRNELINVKKRMEELGASVNQFKIS